MTHTIQCSTPPPAVAAAGNWIRLRFAPSNASPPIASTSIVKSIQLVLDEGQDAGPDNFGLAVIDNIDINGTLIGRGPGRPEESDRDQGRGSDQNRDFSFSNSASRPETSNVSVQDRAQGLTIQSVSASRSISYLGACVTFVTDALLNDDPGYVLTFTACDLSPLSIGNYTIAVAGAQGVVYQATGTLTSGLVSIHLH